MITDNFVVAAFYNYLYIKTMETMYTKLQNVSGANKQYSNKNILATLAIWLFDTFDLRVDYTNENGPTNRNRHHLHLKKPGLPHSLHYRVRTWYTLLSEFIKIKALIPIYHTILTPPTRLVKITKIVCF